MTVRTPEPVAFMYVAKMYVVPCECPDATPLLLTVATAGTEGFQAADCVTSCIDPSL
jgi:hypothetical protein